MGGAYERHAPVIHREEFTQAEIDLVEGLAALGYATGDLLYYDGANLQVLPVGSVGQFLTVTGGVPVWDDLADAAIVIDEDDMASDSDQLVPTQQSVKAYADTKAPDFNYTQTVFVGKHGNDSNDGLSPDQAKLTFGSAITVASGLTPSATNRIAINCVDGGKYSEEITIPSFVHIFAPTATIAASSAANTLTIEDEASVDFLEIIQDQAGPAAVVGANVTGERWVKAQRVTATGASTAIVNFAITTAGIMYIDVISITVATGKAVSDNSLAGQLHVDVDNIAISGNSGIGVFKGGAGTLVGHIDHIEESGTPTTTVGVDINVGTCNLIVATIITDTVYDVASGATLNLTCSSITGTQTNAGTVNVLTANGTSTVPTIGDPADITKTLTHSLSGATTAKKMTIASSHTDNRTLTLPDATDTLVGKTTTDVLTNKAITKRVVTTTDDATAVIDVTATDVYELSAVANATTFSFTGTPVDGQTIIIRFKDAGVTKALTFTGFTVIGVTLPTTTTVSKWHYVGVQYNSAASQWHVIAVTEEA